ncbi:RDD family protein [Mycolicibacter minnesotensis]
MPNHRPEMVTGDAVVLDIAVAQMPVRAVSAMIDIAVTLAGYLFLLIVLGSPMGRFDDALTAGILILLLVLMQVGYPVAMETLTRGRSVGKMAMGLRVVSDDGGPERFRQALVRALAATVEIWALFGSPAVICSLASQQGKRLGDIFAGTVVISERSPKAAPLPVMPPGLAWWASELQLSGLRAESAELARQFLGRAEQLDPHTRLMMAYRISGEVLAHISPPPPPNAPPELVLSAVLAERHRRELARLNVAPPGAYFPPPPMPWPPPSTGGFGGFAPPS